MWSEVKKCDFHSESSSLYLGQESLRAILGTLVRLSVTKRTQKLMLLDGVLHNTILPQGWNFH